MKRLVPLTLLAIILFACNNDNITISKEEYKQLKGNTIKPEYPKEIQPLNNGWCSKYIVITIDSCEYIYMETRSGHGGIALSHKGNCKKCKRDTL